MAVRRVGSVRSRRLAQAAAGARLLQERQRAAHRAEVERAAAALELARRSRLPALRPRAGRPGPPPAGGGASASTQTVRSFALTRANAQRATQISAAAAALAQPATPN